MQIKTFINNNINKSFKILFFISLSIIFLKWINSFLFFGNEDLTLKTINESVSDGYYYFPLIKYLSNFTLNLSYENGINNLSFIPIPFGGIIFHSLILAITDNFFISIIVIEILSLFIFLSIFFLIFNIFLNYHISIFLSLCVFSLSAIFDLFSLSNLPYLRLLETNIYSFRVPRPIVVNLYYFSLMYLFFKYEKNIFFYRKLSLLFSFLFFLLISAFYYYAVVIFILTFFILLKNKEYILRNLKNFQFSYLLSGIIFLLPFLFIYYFHEKDFMERMGSINLDMNNKKILIFSYIKEFIKIKFLFLISFNTLIFFILRKKKLNNNIIDISYLLIFASIISPIFFILVSPKINIYYHFNNIIVIQNFFFLFYSLLIISKNILNKSSSFSFLIVGIIFLLGVNYYNYFKIIKFQSEKRQEIIKLTSEIKKNRSIKKNSNILTFDTKIMVWLILNDFKELKILNGIFTSKKNLMIEDDLFFGLKLLKYNTNEFKKYIENKDKGWRYLNYNIQKFFFQRYLANSFITYKNTKDFSKQEIQKIKSSSPFLVQQSLIPLFEINRLTKNYKKFSLKSIDEERFPEYLILNKANSKNIYKDKRLQYCVIYENKNYLIYELIIKNKC